MRGLKGSLIQFLILLQQIRGDKKIEILVLLIKKDKILLLSYKTFSVGLLNRMVNLMQGFLMGLTVETWVFLSQLSKIVIMEYLFIAAICEMCVGLIVNDTMKAMALFREVVFAKAFGLRNGIFEGNVNFLCQLLKIMCTICR